MLPTMPFMKTGTALHPDLVTLINQVYEEVSGEKLELTK